jgi:hypothetical protein
MPPTYNLRRCQLVVIHLIKLLSYIGDRCATGMLSPFYTALKARSHVEAMDIAGPTAHGTNHGLVCAGRKESGGTADAERVRAKLRAATGRDGPRRAATGRDGPRRAATGSPKTTTYEQGYNTVKLYYVATINAVLNLQTRQACVGCLTSSSISSLFNAYKQDRHV